MNGIMGEVSGLKRQADAMDAEVKPDTLGVALLRDSKVH
jgi:hypothetical protein